MIQNEKIFHSIQNENTAYWLGFLAADGSCKEERAQLILGLSSKDRDHIVKFKKFIGTSASITDRMNKCQNGKSYPASYLTIYSTLIQEDLAQFGIVPNKSHLNIDYLSYIPEQYKIAFILGYFDGDGWFVNTDISLGFGFCGCHALINSIAKYLKDYFQWDSGFNALIYKKSPTISYVSSAGKAKTKDFIQLYLSFQDKCDLLERKKQSALELIPKCEFIMKESLTANEPVPNKICPICKKEFFGRSVQVYCSQECAHIEQRKVSTRPSREELKQLVREKSFLEIGRIYGVSDNAIRKWCVAENIPKNKTDIKKYSDEEWNNI